ncbi:phage GP46 family protein [Sideroxydans lithotrophicus]|uniref:GP46 family protein n=1 Tax=Sideroxydans lithotrophicus (strain ES-1) TaxID=580332 RepID=D5CUF0_SIDLE|nr:phage GP46 family protein [Sideroxydans lithotrophicus]ADE10485.1 GP46 family protein [Sideroxydans lithotrophicus ES-1]
MDALIDPLTRDYVLLDGAIKRDPANGLLNSIYLRLTVPLGSYWEAPTLGSRLYTLEREKDKVRVAKLATQYAKQALDPILESGRATSITVTSEQPNDGHLYLLFEVVAASGETLTFKHPVKVV